METPPTSQAVAKTFAYLSQNNDKTLLLKITFTYPIKNKEVKLVSK